MRDHPRGGRQQAAAWPWPCTWPCPAPAPLLPLPLPLSFPSPAPARRRVPRRPETRWQRQRPPWAASGVWAAAARRRRARGAPRAPRRCGTAPGGAAGPGALPSRAAAERRRAPVRPFSAGASGREQPGDRGCAARAGSRPLCPAPGPVQSCALQAALSKPPHPAQRPSRKAKASPRKRSFQPAG